MAAGQEDQPTMTSFEGTDERQPLIQKEDASQPAKEDEPPSGDDVVDARLIKMSKLVPPYFTLTGAIFVVLVPLGILTITSGVGTIVGLAVVSGVAGGVGAYGMYKWGTVQAEIDRMAKENDKYQTEVVALQQTRGQLEGEVTAVKSSVNTLKERSTQLQEQLSEMDDLKTQLEGLCDSNQDIFDMVTQMNSMMDHMEEIEHQNEVASLMEMYYDISLKDSEEGLSAAEYKRLLARLPTKQRSQMEAMGGFEQLAGDDDVIDLHEFECIIERLLSETHETRTSG